MWNRAGIFWACGIALLLLSGCGGGGAAGNGGGTTGLTITKATEGNYSTDALALTTRATEGPWLSGTIAGMFDTDLTRIRTQYPQLANIHTRGDYTLNDMLIGVRLDSPWRANWEQGALTTGETNLDTVLHTYFADSVKSDFTSSDREWFLVTFDNPLNTRGLVPILQQASSSIVSAEPNNYVGGGDDITFKQAGGNKTYVLSHGWGDCSSGCINRHYWTVTISPEGTLTLQESGTTIPPDGGRIVSSTDSRPTRASVRQIP